MGRVDWGCCGGLPRTSPLLEGDPLLEPNGSQINDIFIYIVICMYVCMYVGMYQGRIGSVRFKVRSVSLQGSLASDRAKVGLLA